MRQFKRKANEDGFWRECDKYQPFTSCINSDDKILYKDQENFLGIVLDHVLENTMGLYLLVKHKDNPRKVWLAHQEHQQNSESSMREAQNLLVKIYELRIKNFPTRIDFLTTWTRLLAEHGDISEALNDATKSSILQVAVRLDPAMVTMFSNFLRYLSYVCFWGNMIF